MNALTVRRFCVLLALLIVAYTSISLARAPRVDSFLIGDCPYYTAAGESLLRDGDWDLRNQLPGDITDHHGFFALSADGRIVPKHSVLLPLLSLPFYAVMGTWGLLFFNVMQMFGLVYGIMLLAGGGPGARFLALLAYLSSPLLAYTFNYSPDVLGTVLFVWSYVFALRQRFVLCGLCAGLAVWAKIYFALILLPVALIVVPRGWRPTLRCGIAAFVAVAPMLVIQAHLFGSPFVTGYDRDARLTEAGYIVTEHYSRFHVPLLTGFGNLLFDGRIGMLRTAPLWWLWPFGVYITSRDRKGANVATAPLRSRLVVMSLVLSLVINILFFARYDEWDASVFGNRFLFPAMAVGFALQGPLWQRALDRMARVESA